MAFGQDAVTGSEESPSGGAASSPSVQAAASNEENRVEGTVSSLSVPAEASTEKSQQSRIPPREYYSVILNRKPFGDTADLRPSAPVDQQAELAAAEQAKQEQTLARQIDMVAITRSPTGKTLVGLVDKSDGKNPRNYCLAAGESAGGFTITEADFKEETATIERDGISITLKLGKGIVQKAGENDSAGIGTVYGNGRVGVPPSAAFSGQNPASRPPHSALNAGNAGMQQQTTDGRPALGLRRPGLLRPGESATSGIVPGTQASGYLDRLRERKANEAATQEEIAKLRKEVADAAKTSKDEAAKRERAINLELISRGQQPLSQIELTPEEDAELVRKGVLAPEGKQ